MPSPDESSIRIAFGNATPPRTGIRHRKTSSSLSASSNPWLESQTHPLTEQSQDPFQPPQSPINSITPAFRRILDDELDLSPSSRPTSVRTLSSSSSRDDPQKKHDVEPGRDVLVHELEPKDSLASVAIKYGVPIADIRKLNKLWSSDSIHLRKTIFIPPTRANEPSPDKSKSEWSNSRTGGTVRRVPLSQLSFFPPGAAPSDSTLQTNQSNGTLPTHKTSSSQTLKLSHLFDVLPATEAIISRLSFDSSRASEASDDMEHEMTVVRNSTPSRRTIRPTSGVHLREQSGKQPESLWPESPLSSPMFGHSPPGEHVYASRFSMSAGSEAGSPTPVRTSQPQPSASMQLPDGLSLGTSRTRR